MKGQKRLASSKFLTILTLAVGMGLGLARHQAFAAERSIKIVNYEYEGTKQWLPGTVVVEEGDDVTLTLINNVPSGVHGFSIPDFKQKVDVKKGEPQTLKFKADKTGIFPISCHLHPAHVGGQFVVLKK